MKIVIISDIHDNLVNLEKALSWSRENNFQELICCGDVTNGETLKYLSDNFSGPVHLVKGNIELYDENEIEKYGNIKFYGKVGKIKLKDKVIGFCHEPDLITEIINSGKGETCDIIFYGHTHKPWESEKGGIKLVNPGNLAGVFQKATFATFDTDSGKLELKILEIL